jgi:hypothetical protein
MRISLAESGLSQGLVPENNQQQAAAPRTFCFVHRKPRGGPSDYGMLVISQKMASSPFLEP